MSEVDPFTLINLRFYADVNLPKEIITSEGFDNLLPKYLELMGEDARDFWVSEAGRKLRSSYLRYSNAITYDVSDSLLTMSLGGYLTGAELEFVTAVEIGGPGFDMKPGFLKGGTPYRRVPLNINHDPFFTPITASEWRTVTPASDGWQHPGWDGVNLTEIVEQELMNTIIPKHLEALLDELFL